jgi:aquaporin Z
MKALHEHWREYLMEAFGLGAFMVSACLFTALLEHPGSPLRLALPDALTRRALMGLAMGATAIAIIYSPWGRRSGAHINPSVTLTFLRLGRIGKVDAAAYVAAQCLGAVLGVLLCGALGVPLADPSVNWVVTRPGVAGVQAAFAAELAISFLLMSVVLGFSRRPAIERWTGVAAGVCVAAFIAFEAPFSGMSMNPARTLGSALPSGVWSAFWLYLMAPSLGMLVAAELWRRLDGMDSVGCAKLRHCEHVFCIFCGRQPTVNGSVWR